LGGESETVRIIEQFKDFLSMQNALLLQRAENKHCILLLQIPALQEGAPFTIRRDRKFYTGFVASTNDFFHFGSFKKSISPKGGTVLKKALKQHDVILFLGRLGRRMRYF
jgi:hypothetical protein